MDGIWISFDPQNLPALVRRLCDKLHILMLSPMMHLKFLCLLQQPQEVGTTDVHILQVS